MFIAHSAPLLIGLICFSIAPVQAAATFTPLGVFGGVRSNATDVSADGSAVVGFSNVGLFRWTAMESMVRAALERDGAAVSGDGSVVVGSHIVLGAANQAFRWTAGGSFETLSGFPGGPVVLSSAAFDASVDGSVVVGGANTAVDDVAFRWTQATGMVGLGDLPGGRTRSTAFGVSADGAVVVGEGYSADDRPEAFRWTQAGMVGLGRLPIAERSIARRVSADGSTVVGVNAWSAPGPMDPHSQAFRWTQAEGMRSLGDLPGGVLLNEALDVSADGSVVVGWATTVRVDGQAPRRAFYWTATTGMVDLQQALVAAGATNLDGWHILEATGVSADGLTIVGTAAGNGRAEAFIATIPEPSTIALAGSGAAGFLGFYLRAKRRRSRADQMGDCSN